MRHCERITKLNENKGHVLFKKFFIFYFDILLKTTFRNAKLLNHLCLIISNSFLFFCHILGYSLSLYCMYNIFQLSYDIVYLRFFFQLFSNRKNIFRNVVCSSYFITEECTISVSYTHLDVYKRQS